MVLRRLQQHTRLRLAAVAVLLIRVVADLHCVERQFPEKSIVHGLDDFYALFARANVRLIGDDDIQISGRAQLRERLLHPRQNYQSGERVWRVRFPFPDDRCIQYAVTIQENGSMHDA